MRTFEHEAMPVYQRAIEFLSHADTVAAGLPRGRAYLADQLRRAASSIALNIAEGVGEFAPVEKARFYRMARRSVTECGAILDVLRVLALAAPEQLTTGRALLLELVAILTAMIKSRLHLAEG